MNFCTSCKHVSKQSFSGGDFQFHQCRHPGASLFRDLVDGEYPICSDMRENQGDRCGPDGLWFEKEEV